MVHLYAVSLIKCDRPLYELMAKHLLLGIEMEWGCSSAGEHFVDIEGVTGSIPVTPTILIRMLSDRGARCLHLDSATLVC